MKILPAFPSLYRLVLVLPLLSNGTAFTTHGTRRPFVAGPTIGRLPVRAESLQLNAFLRKLFKRKQSDEGSKSDIRSGVTVTAPPDFDPMPKIRRRKKRPTETVDIVVVGGGVSGLAAAITAANATKNCKIVLLEASETFGGRVQSDKTDDGFVLDRGFAVFIEQYPAAKALLDYDKLNLNRFLPGALVKIKGRNQLARVADPLRQPGEIVAALFAPVGSLPDKLALLPLIYHSQATSIEELFEEEEIDTLTALKVRWGFSEDMLDRFFRPFLEGIYLAPLTEQSSRMFSFVFKMFSEGYATLPAGGMGAVAEQMCETAGELGVDLRPNVVVTGIVPNDSGCLVQTKDGKSRIQAKSVVLATDGEVAVKLLSQLDGFDAVKVSQPQRQVGCLYYSFKGAAPVSDPILILSGIGPDRGSVENPVNNVCFPSVVSGAYAPDGSSLCSVTVLGDAMAAYEGREDELDKTVRKQLSTWFPEIESDVLTKWELRKIYSIPNAQPSQLGGPSPANINGGRDCYKYRGKTLPSGILLCGDHMATATLNGALESGVKAGIAAAKNV